MSGDRSAQGCSRVTRPLREMSGAPTRREKEKLRATDFHASFSWCRRTFPLLQVHVEEPVARVACHIIMYEEELLIMVRREVAHGLLQLRDAADEFFHFA